jgi:hypothetical protein
LRGRGASRAAAGYGHDGQESERLPARGARGKDTGQSIELMVHDTFSAALMESKPAGALRRWRCAGTSRLSLGATRALVARYRHVKKTSSYAP